MSIFIRPAKPEDIEAVMPLMFSAGPDAFRYVFSIKERNQVLSFLRQAFLSGGGEFGYQEHYVVCHNQQILGLIGLRQSKDNFRYTLSALQNIIRFYGLFDGMKVIYRGLQFERIVKPPTVGRLCVHNLAVSEQSRGQGIGKQLINFAIDQAKVRCIDMLCLDVAETNPRAKALYQRLGFETKHTRAGGLANTFGRGVSHDYMELPLTKVC